MSKVQRSTQPVRLGACADFPACSMALGHLQQLRALRPTAFSESWTACAALAARLASFIELVADLRTHAGDLELAMQVRSLLLCGLARAVADSVSCSHQKQGARQRFRACSTCFDAGLRSGSCPASGDRGHLLQRWPYASAFAC